MWRSQTSTLVDSSSQFEWGRIGSQKAKSPKKTEQMFPVCLRKRTSEVNSPAAPVATAAAHVRIKLLYDRTG